MRLFVANKLLWLFWIFLWNNKQMVIKQIHSMIWRSKAEAYQRQSVDYIPYIEISPRFDLHFRCYFSTHFTETFMTHHHQWLKRCMCWCNEREQGELYTPSSGITTSRQWIVQHTCSISQLNPRKSQASVMMKRMMIWGTHPWQPAHSTSSRVSSRKAQNAVSVLTIASSPLISDPATPEPHRALNAGAITHHTEQPSSSATHRRTMDREREKESEIQAMCHVHGNINWLSRKQ